MIDVLIVILGVAVSYRSWLCPIGLHDDVSSILRQESSAWKNLNWYGRGRPLYRVINQIQKEIWGWNPVAWHRFNTIVHAINGCLLYHVLWTRFPKSAAFVALGFVVHPIQTATVNYLTGRSGMLSGFFLITAVGLYWQAGVMAYGSVVAFWLAMLCREDSIVFVLWLPLLMWG